MSKYFFYCCLGFLIGVLTASLFDLYGWPLIFFCLAIFVSALVYFRKKPVATCSLLFVVCCLLGSWRYFSAIPSANFFANLPLQSVRFSGLIISEPETKINGVAYVLRTAQFGRVLVQTNSLEKFVYGTELNVRCVLERAKPIEDFKYDKYLATKKIFLLCRSASVSIKNLNQGNPLVAQLFRFKYFLRTKVGQLWSEPYATFMAGLLWGDKPSVDLQDLFRAAGISHILAISGYNITIIASILLSAAWFCRIRRPHALALCSLLIVLFVIFVGASASVVRAGIMGLLVFLARATSRLSRPINLVLLAAASMLIYNPFFLLFDVGFQLSFAATLGLLYLSPKLENFFQWLPETLHLRESAVSTISATMATLPISFWQFHQIAPFAPLINLLVLWAVPYTMLVGVLAIFVSFFSTTIGTGLAFVSYILMTYIIGVARLI